MTRFLCDTNVLIARIRPDHIHHEAVRLEIDGRLRKGETMGLASHTLVEAYSVLTRLPQPHRLSPEDAFALIEANFKRFEIISLTSAETLKVLRGLKNLGLGGGVTYDALILAAAKKFKAAALLTGDLRDFRRLDPESEIELIAPD